MDAKKIAICLPKSLVSKLKKGSVPFYGALIDCLENAGHKVTLGAEMPDQKGTDGLVIAARQIANGQEDFVASPTIFNRYWSLTSKGAGPEFDKKKINKSRAESYFYDVTEKEIEKPNTPYPIDNFILAAMQSRPRRKGMGAWCSGVKMIERSLKQDPEKPMVIWLPEDQKFEDKDMALIEEIRQSHDHVFLSKGDPKRLLPSCAYIVTQNHPIAFWGQFYRKPSILFCDQQDWANMEKIYEEQRPKRSFNRVNTVRYEFEKFIYWYFKEFSIDVRDAEFDQVVLNRLGLAD